jgi:O-acetylserine/cysteine efflux transporter
MLVPVVGVLASWLAFGEVPDAVELLAGVLVVSGVLFASVRPARSAPAEIVDQPRVIGLTMSATNSSADIARNTPATT